MGRGPASGSQGGLDHSGRVWRPQQPPGRRPGPRPSEPPHKEMFVPQRRGLWAVAPLAPSCLPPPPSVLLPSPSCLLPAQASSQTGGPDWGGGTREEPPRAGRGIRPTPSLPGAGRDGREGDVGLDWEVGEGQGPCSVVLLPCCSRGTTCLAWQKPAGNLFATYPQQTAWAPGLPCGGRGWVGSTHLGQPGPWLCNFRGAPSWSF